MFCLALTTTLILTLTNGIESDTPNIAPNGDDNNENQDETTTPANIIFIMMDDLGRTDIGSYGAEWDTPNIDKFLESSITLSNHYVGYVCSVSRSQFLTGRYSFHSGYGMLDVFDLDRLGYVPFQTPMLQEYLHFYGDYKTYAVGKWQLGSPLYDNMAVSRGFDHFYGFNGGKQDYYDKTTGGKYKFTDFWEDNNPTIDWSDGYSTDQYFSKMTDIVSEHNEQYGNTKPFYIYAAMQAAHDPFPEYSDESEWTEYYKTCYNNYLSTFDEFKDRLSVCECMIGVDTQLGNFINYLKNDESLKENNIWENTLIIFTSDNGGSIDKGACNYPLRGGKNTFYEGNTRVLAAVGGGRIPTENQGKVLEGLVSNVDWVPTLLAFANVISPDQETIQFDTDSSYLSLDGFNLYNFLTSPDTSSSTNSGRDHVVFHLLPQLDSTTNEFTKDINEYSITDMKEVALIFYDDDGNLWKYLDVTESTNVVGDPTTNSGWCVNIKENELEGIQESNSDDTYQLMPNVGVANKSVLGLWEISVDGSEKRNFLEFSGLNIENTKLETVTNLKPIVEDIINYYVNYDNMGNKNSKYLYGNFYCFVDIHNHYYDALNAAQDAQFWVPYMNDRDELFDAVINDCNINEDHQLYQLFTTDWTLPNDINEIRIDDEMDERRVEMRERLKKLNKRGVTVLDTVIDEIIEESDIKELGMVGNVEGEVKGVKGFVFGVEKKDDLMGIVAGMIVLFVLTVIGYCAAKKYLVINGKLEGYQEI